MWWCTIVVLLLYLLKGIHNFNHQKINNVCKTIGDYYNDPDSNKNCFYNPDMYLKVPEIIQRHGYSVKNYTVVTQDSYILTVFRLFHKKHLKKNSNKPPVFIQHGIGISSMVFVDIGKKSLAFLLADQGYDVWLGNFRGSSYSNEHVFLKNTQKEYWYFTFHENGIYDLPAQLDLVTNQTNSKVIYIGYSMGTTAFFVFNSEMPEVAKEKVEISISLAPITFMDHINNPLKSLASLWPLIKNQISHVTNGVLNERTPASVKQRLEKCLPFPTQMRACRAGSNILFGYDPAQEDPETLPVVVIQDFDAMCVRTLDHYIQLIDSGGFLKYDHGKEGNMKLYKTPKPPAYNLKNVNVPIYLIRADNDPLGNKENVEQLYRALPSAVKQYDIYVVPLTSFSHGDFVTARDVKFLIYDHVIKFIGNIKMSDKN